MIELYYEGNTSYPVRSLTSSLPPNMDCLGYFTRYLNKRDLPERMLDYDITIIDCTEAYKGYSYLGRQSCCKWWCGNGDYGKYGISYNYNCDGIYVGRWKMNHCLYKYMIASTSVLPTLTSICHSFRSTFGIADYKNSFRSILRISNCNGFSTFFGSTHGIA